MSATKRYEIKRYSVSQIKQGRFRFFTLTVPSAVLTQCCFVTTRFDDPMLGFQRLLEKNRAQEIAHYIDEGFGTIPSSIVLSAQSEANLSLVGKGKTLQFKAHPKAFLILDGQHRVYGFSLAKSNLRIPVVIYNGLSRRDETRLFIDINSKQKGVPNELLLDIKQLAEYETDIEEELRDLFDLFMQEAGSCFLGKMSAASRTKDKISRVTFNAAIKPIIRLFGSRNSNESYQLLNSYYAAFNYGLQEMDSEISMTHSTVFRAISAFFPDVASKVKDRFGSDYTVDNYYTILEPMFSRLKPTRLKKPGSSYKSLLGYFTDAMRTEFEL